MRKAFEKRKGPLSDLAQPEAEREALSHLISYVSLMRDENQAGFERRKTRIPGGLPAGRIEVNREHAGV